MESHVKSNIYSMPLEREFRFLEMIEDNYRKYVLTMDTLALEGRNGIHWQNIVDWSGYT
jgi:hypothetical protein